ADPAPRDDPHATGAPGALGARRSGRVGVVPWGGIGRLLPGRGSPASGGAEGRPGPARRAVLAVAGALTATCALTLAPGTASAAPDGPATAPAGDRDARYSRYVALGDSYVSGPLIPLMRLDPPGCFRSTANYPALLARDLRVRSFTDMSCGGADTTHMTRPQAVPLGGVNPPQLDPLTRQTDLVTLSIGGNDFGIFGELTRTCPELRPQDPTGNPCQRHYTVDGVDTLIDHARRVSERVSTILRAVHERAPRAHVVLVGYPRIAPPSGACPAILPFADGDLRWLDAVERALNTSMADAAERDGTARYVDTYGTSLGHDACAPGDQAWIQGKDTDPLAAASYHPRRGAMVGVAEQVRRALADGAHARP
ncbi:SGNH/GDSL hydrolase family protein, partial [Streptomyces buecherae]|uniref:SGNH/GDSL hydrolase family protein n=1 Tax=Streptomyces buecherae TaxID=2763006 RepID=UPI001C9AEF67